MAIGDVLKQAWNAFRPSDQAKYQPTYGSATYSDNSESKPRRRFFSEKSIITSIYTRIGIDVAAIPFRHCKVDAQNRYQEDILSNLNTCFSLEANLDQGPRAFRQDSVMTLFDKGCAALVPVDTTKDPNTNEIVDIFTLRVGEIVRWYPKHICVSVYNEATGKRQEITLEKRFVAIVENPLYSVMNAPNSTLQRLIRKLSLLDDVDEQTSSGKLDLIIQLPYVIKSEARRIQAEKRREDIEFQLKGSKYGIAYTDGTEKITQLNRPVENDLLNQVKWLTEMLYGQLGITAEVMNGTADQAVMLNYYHRTIEPIIDAIQEAMQRAFLGHIGTANLERIMYFSNPFRLVPIGDIAEIADSLTRNEITSSNEIRGFIGMVPSKDPKADQLINSNINPNVPQPATGVVEDPNAQQASTDVAQSALDDLGNTIDVIFKDLGYQVMGVVEEFLEHAAIPYDPVKAHLYYLRTRQLKGRHPGATRPITAGRVAAAQTTIKQTPKPVLKPKTPEQQKKEIEARVKVLKIRLQQLHAILKELVNKAQGHTVIGKDGKPSGLNKKSPTAGSKASSTHLTGAQKAEARKKSKAAYKKTHPNSLSEQEKQIRQQIKEVELKIVAARDKLKASLARAQSKLNSN